MQTCQRCEKQYTYTRGTGCTKVHCASCMVNRQRHKKKQKAINYKGGKCQYCGYDKCQRNLCFHHIDASQKDFSLSGKHCYSWERIKEELDKCILLCANCHGELHDREESERREKRKSYDQAHPSLKLKKRTPSLCLDCKKPITYGSIRCNPCLGKKKERINWPPIEELLTRISKSNRFRVSKELGISETAVRKRIKKYS